jgi:pyruvate-formate lyase-activating enzyme
MLTDAAKFEKAEAISVSGGGDPLFEYENHKKYYSRLFRICREMGLPLEMHTSIIESEFPYERCHRVVYHLHDFDQLAKIVRHRNEIVRVVFVVTKKFKPELIDKIADFVENSDVIDELSFRQMVDKDYAIRHYCHDYLTEGHQKRWWYILQDDYNSYFVNGTIHYRFSDISTGGGT